MLIKQVNTLVFSNELLVTQILIFDRYVKLPDSTPTSGIWGARLPTVVLSQG